MFCEYFNEIDLALRKKFGYIYSTDGCWTRKTYHDDYIVYECVEEQLDEIIRDDNIDGNPIFDKRLCMDLQLARNYDINKAIDDRVIMLGRYAQWNHSVKINEVIERVLKIRDGRL